MVKRVALGLVCLAGCELRPLEAPPYNQASCNLIADDGTTPATVEMRFDALDADFFAAPFPTRGRAPGGRLDGYRFPVSTPLMSRLRNLLSRDGAGISSGIYFGLDHAVLPGTKLPPHYTLPVAGAGATVLLFPRDAPLELAPINVEIRTTRFADPSGAKTLTKVLLSIVPVQGLPLRESTDYVAVVTTDVAQQGTFMQALCGGSAPGLTADDLAAYQSGIQAAAQLGLGCQRIAGISVFHTSDPTAQLRAVQLLAAADFASHQGMCRVRLEREKDQAGEGPRCLEAPFCVFSGTVRVPQYQRGTPPFMPYFDWGGGWPKDAPVPAPSAAPAACDGPSYEPTPPVAAWTPTWRSARVVVTIPRRPPEDPTRGYPTVALARTGGGSTTDTLVDRGPIRAPSCQVSSCQGPAEVFQSVGFAGISVDGPLVGISRNEPLELNEDLGIFDFLNPEALLDNIRQSAVELALIPDILKQIDIDLSQCEGAGSNQGPLFDGGHLALFSHSMGSTISPLALAAEPRFGAAIMSGSGGSLIENALYKTKPVPINAAATLLGYGCTPEDSDPQLALLQWALEPADSQSYARRLVVDRGLPGTWSSPNARSVLMIQGLVDHYIPPPIADVMTLGDGLDLGLGPGSCNGDPYCDRQPVHGEVGVPAGFPPLADLLPLSGHTSVDLASVTGNIAWPTAVNGRLTAVLVQHRIDENRELGAAGCDVDGHEVIYESTLARHQYACFLSDFAHDRTPAVRASGGVFDGCGP